MKKKPNPIINNNFAARHPVIINLTIILAVAALGIWIVY